MTSTMVTKRMTEMFELLPEADQGLIMNFISRLLSDDIATQEDIDDMNQAEVEHYRGECYSLDDLTLK